MSTTFVRGLSPQEFPLPEPELSLGNIVRLKQPYVADRRTQYTHGIIVEHVGYNAFGKPMVSLNVYDDTGKLHLVEKSPVPACVDTVATDLILLYVCKDNRMFPQGFDLYPICLTCNNIDQHPFKEGGPCPDCGGWGCVREMQRLPPD